MNKINQSDYSERGRWAVTTGTGDTPLIAYRSSYTTGTALGFEPLAAPCRLSEAERQRIEEVGRLAASVLRKGCGLLADALVSQDPRWNWLIDIMFASVPVEHRDLARAVMIKSGATPPTNFRLDLLGDGTIAEIQCPGSGWGFLLPLEALYGIKREDSAVIRAFGQWFRGRRGVWWLYNEAISNSVVHLADVCRAHGVRFDVCTTEEFNPDDPTMDVVVKRPPLPELLSEPKGRQLLRRWMDGRIEMDPAPSMMPETKFITALLHHPLTRHLFTAEEQGICHPTFIVESMEQQIDFQNGFGMRPFRIGDLAGASESQRRVVLKYGGARKWDRFGGHAVFALSKMGKRHEREEIIKRAVLEGATGEAWIVQPFVAVKRTTASLGLPVEMHSNAEHYVLWRPGYQIRDGSVIHVGTIVNLRSSWKVHGASDTKFGIAQ